MAHRRLVTQACSQWPTTIAISTRVFPVYTGSATLRTANATKIPANCRTYRSTSTVGIPQKLPISPKSETSQSFSAHTPPSPKPATDTPSSLQSQKPQKLKKQTKLAPEVVFYHNPASAASMKTLSLLQSAQIAYPRTKRRTGPPLDFKLKILERLPTTEELQDMYGLLNEASWTIFRATDAASNYRHHPTSARNLLDLIGHERQEEIAKANKKAHDDVIVTMTPAPPPSTEPSADDLPAVELAILDISHPLFGTQTFPWPVLVYMDAKKVIVGPRLKNLDRLLKDLANERDGHKSKEQLKEEAEKAKQANWSYPEKEVPPDEDDTVKWFNESNRKAKQLFR